MKTKYDRVWAEIDLDAVCSNMEAMKQNLAPDTKLAGVVKADGYGHGAVPIAWAIDPYVAMYAVATIEEAILLRKHQITKPILILGVVPESQFKNLVQYDLDSAVFELGEAMKLSDEAIRQGKKAGIHLAVDTGMSRIGFLVCEEAAEEACQIVKLSGIRLDGMFTHFARADEACKEAAEKQYEAFMRFDDMLKKRGVDVLVRHCSNSAAILELPKMHMDMARAGISIYGMYPSDEMKRDQIILHPALQWKCRVSYIKEIEAGVSVSYGGMFTADQKMRVATLPVGYADGYPRGASSKGEVLIHGKRAKILGRICMDQCMVDVSDIPEAVKGDEVTLVGKDGKDEIMMEELARWCKGFHYELCCDIGKRVPRVYIKNGKVVGYKDYFNDRYEMIGN